MKLGCVYARFYKSFNFDQRRAAHELAKPYPWEDTNRGWYPYIEVSIHELITTIVGANESGKSHLLNAIEIAVTGQGFRRQDLCRYSDFFNVEVGNDFWPHLGVSWTDLTDEEAAKLRAEVSEAPEDVRRFHMFREGPDKLDLYFPTADGYSLQTLTGAKAHKFGQTWLPIPFRIESRVGLPRALPVSELVKAGGDATLSRAQRSELVNIGQTVRGAWTGKPDTFVHSLGGLASQLLSPLAKLDSLSEPLPDERRLSYDLARSLLIRLGKVEPKRLEELGHYLEQGEDGQAAGIADKINEQLAKELNFPKFWVQDRDFQLLVRPYESEISFTIKDRTGTQYTFDERSAGLKYFLSYFIQSQTHQPHETRSEILLMDEPDAYLSAEAQQDLLKIFTGFAQPEGDQRPIQVVYVTHSPFLLDKNHADRIRVLQKGKGADGTRVIKNASQNHYEPLRSAIGAYVGESAFIGSCNLLVEGVADQIFLAGMSRLIQADGPVALGEILDLNTLVVVPCGSAGHVPYMLYLVRGRDAEVPPVVVLLDGDDSGKAAFKELTKGPMRKLIEPEYVLAFDVIGLARDAAHPVLEPEDLIPPGLAAAAARRYFEEISLFRDEQTPEFTTEAVAAALSPKVGIFDAIKTVAQAAGSHVDKVGFARALVAVCAVPPAEVDVADIATLKQRMKALFTVLNQKRRKAELDRLKERSSAKIERHRKIFLREHSEGANKEQALMLFEKIEVDLDQSLDAEGIRAEMIAMKKRFELDGDPLDPIADYPQFLRKLATLKEAYARGVPVDEPAAIAPSAPPVAAEPDPVVAPPAEAPPPRPKSGAPKRAPVVSKG